MKKDLELVEEEQASPQESSFQVKLTRAFSNNVPLMGNRRLIPDGAEGWQIVNNREEDEVVLTPFERETVHE